MNLNIELIRASFEEVKPIAHDFISYFYKTLFEKYPESRSLFEKINREKHKSAHIPSLVTIIDNLDKRDYVTSILKEMGASYKAYDAETEHFNQVGDSLLITFRYFFGKNWSTDLDTQWSMAIGFIAQQMILGATVASTTLNEKMTLKTIAPVAIKADLSDLSQFARHLAKNILMHALEKELEGEVARAVQKKANALLLQALRDEADKIQTQLAKKAA